MEQAPPVWKIWIAGAFCLLSLSLYAQYQYSDRCLEATNAIFELRFSDADLLLQSEARSNPGNPVPAYLRNRILCLSLFISEDPKLFVRYKNESRQHLRQLERGGQNSPYYRFFLGHFYLEWAFVRLKFREYTRAALDMRRAYILFSENEKMYPGFILNSMGMGLVRTAVGLVPEPYEWIPEIVGLKGSPDQGWRDLTRVSGYSGDDPVIRVFQQEVAFYQIFISLNVRNDALPVARSSAFHSGIPDSGYRSPLMIFAKASLLTREGKNGEALRVLSARHLLNDRFPFQYLDYLEGVTRLNNLDYSARDWFQNYLREYRGHNYLRAATQRLAWIAFLRGDSTGYLTHMKQTSRGSGQTDEDSQARQLNTTAAFPNLYLLRARLLYDGGYYHRALKELLHHSLKIIVRKPEDFVEYQYRLGRIYQALDRLNQSLACYQMAIEKGKSMPRYFAASASLQTGLILENRKEYDLARTAFSEVLTMPFTEYRNSLRQKAKAGIERIKSIR